MAELDFAEIQNQGQMDILIGTRNPVNLRPLESIDTGGPLLIKTVWGWSMMGPTEKPSFQVNLTQGCLTQDTFLPSSHNKGVTVKDARMLKHLEENTTLEKHFSIFPREYLGTNLGGKQVGMGGRSGVEPNRCICLSS